jgi:hypothetical protein
MEARGDDATWITFEHALSPELLEQRQDGWTRIAEQLTATMRSS